MNTVYWDNLVLDLIKVCYCSKYFEWTEIWNHWLWCTTRVCIFVEYEVSRKAGGQRQRRVILYHLNTFQPVLWLQHGLDDRVVVVHMRGCW